MDNFDRPGRIATRMEAFIYFSIKISENFGKMKITWQIPGPRAQQNLQMPHPWDWQGGQMPRISPRGGGEGGLGAAGIDWCINVQIYNRY